MVVVCVDDKQPEDSKEKKEDKGGMQVGVVVMAGWRNRGAEVMKGCWVLIAYDVPQQQRRCRGGSSAKVVQSRQVIGDCAGAEVHHNSRQEPPCSHFSLSLSCFSFASSSSFLSSLVSGILHSCRQGPRSTEGPATTVPAGLLCWPVARSTSDNHNMGSHDLWPPLY